MMSVLRSNGSTSSACLSNTEFVGRSDHAASSNVQQRLVSNFFAGSRLEDGVPSTLNASRRRSSTPTRCLYSPLVETYESSRIKPHLVLERAKRDHSSNDGESPLSTSSVACLKPKETALETHYVQDVFGDEEGAQGIGNKNRSATEECFPAPQDPIVAAHGDSSLVTTASDGGHDFELRRTGRFHPQTMSLTHGFRHATNQGVSCAIGVAGRSLANATRIGGPTGLMMGLAVAGLGLATAIHKAAEGQPQQKICTRCDGYGVERCDVCNGVGQISWEGKVHRTNPCPRCFGSRLKKCPRCDGCRVKKESTPVLQMLKASPKKRP